MDSTQEIPGLRPLARDRPLTAAERDLVAALVAHARCPELTEQVATARVTATCSCGCSSLGLATDGPAVPAITIRRLSESGRDDYFRVAATAGEVTVWLHIADRMLHELEIYAGDGVQIPLPAVEGLDIYEVS